MTISPTWWSKDTVAVVTGANKGIGYEIVRLLGEKGLTVVLTARDPAKGQVAIDSLKAAGLHSIVFHALEVTSPESVQKLAAWLKSTYGGIDILINNAAIISNQFDFPTAKSIVETNYGGTKLVTETLLPLLRASPAGARIINVTTRAGLYERLAGESLKQKFRNPENYSTKFADSLSAQYLEDVKAGKANEKDWAWIPLNKMPMYSDSKIILNAYSASFAKSLLKSQPEDHKIFLASFCPGVTQTEMLQEAFDGGFETPEGFELKTAADGADTGVWLALLPKEELAEKAGKLFGERSEYPFGWENPPL